MRPGAEKVGPYSFLFCTYATYIPITWVLTHFGVAVAPSLVPLPLVNVAVSPLLYYKLLMLLSIFFPASIAVTSSLTIINVIVPPPYGATIGNSVVGML